MAGWLSRATDAFRRPPPPAPEPYSIWCDCGATHTGIRVSAAQKPACAECGRPVFVLPLNIYPVPVKRVRRDGNGTSPPKEVAGFTSTAPRPLPQSTGRGKSSVPTQQTSPSTQGLVEPPTRWFTPFRLVVAVIVVIAIGTGWGLRYRSRVEAAKATVSSAKEAGLKALHEGDFATAAIQLQAASNAVDLLGRKDGEAELIRRCCREATAGHELSDGGLFEMLGESARADGKPGRLNARHRNAWILFDTIVLAQETAQRCALDIPIEIDGRKFRVEIQSSLIRAMAERSDGSTPGRVIFAAKPLGIEARSDEPSVLVLTLDGKSAFAWSSFETYSALGYRESDAAEQQATRDLLTRQLEMMESAR